MLSLSPATRIFVAVQPVDMRAGFNRLYAHVETRLNQDPLRGHRFVFTQASDVLSLGFVFIDIPGLFQPLWALECSRREYYGTCHCHIRVRPPVQSGYKQYLTL